MNFKRNIPRSSFKWPGIILLAVSALALLFYFTNADKGTEGGGAEPEKKYRFSVGAPKAGDKAPNIVLPSTEDSMFDLSSLKGQTVLLFFQEGIMCQPCWDQVREIETSFDSFRSLGIDTIVTISTDPLKELKQKVEMERLSTLFLSDESVQVSEAYTTNRYTMMGKNYNGHSFIVVGPDGIIKWRADYGGSPDYTMYVPVSNLLADMAGGLKGEGGQAK